MAKQSSLALNDETAAAMLDGMLPSLGISIDPAWRAEIIANVKVNVAMAERILAFPLADDVEMAPVFVA